MWRHGVNTIGLLTLFLFGTEVRAAIPAGQVEAIACAPKNPDGVAVLTGGTVWITLDGGITWTPLPFSRGSLEAESQFSAEVEDTPLSHTTSYEPDESAPATSEPPRLEWEFDPVENRAAPPGTVPPAPMANHLAVDDDGTVAFSFGDRFFVGNPQGARLERTLPNITGLAIDPDGRTWVAQNDTLLLLAPLSEGATEQKRWQIRGASSPRVDGKKNELLVPGREGIFVVDLSTEKTGVVRLGEVTGVAAYGDDRAAILRGRVVAVDFETEARRDLPSPPQAVSQLEADETGRIFAKTAMGQWFVLTGDTWRSLGVTALDVSASGVVWVGTAFGPTLLEDRLSGVMATTAKEARALHMMAREKLAISPGRPPLCRVYPINPLPRAGFYFGMGRGLGLFYNLYPQRNPAPMNSQIGMENEFYFGFSFVWSLDPMDPSECYYRRQRFSRIKTRRGVEIETLLRTRLKPRGYENIQDAISRVVEQKRIEQLLVVLTRVHPEEESTQ